MKVLFFGSVREYTLGEKAFEAGDPPCVRALIKALGEHFGPKCEEFLLGDDTCMLLVNGKGIMATGGLDAPLHPDDTVEVLPFVEGG